MILCVWCGRTRVQPHPGSSGWAGRQNTGMEIPAAASLSQFKAGSKDVTESPPCFILLHMRRCPGFIVCACWARVKFDDLNPLTLTLIHEGHTQGWLMLCEWEIIHQFNADISYVDGIFYSRSHTCKHRACASNSRCIYSGDIPSKILHSFSFLQMPQMWGQGCLSPKKGWRCVTRV